jgi:chromosome segregation ATPase
MVGLYRKALAFRLDIAGPPKVEDRAAEIKEWVSLSEEIEIMGELSKLTEKSRLQITEETFAFSPSKNDHWIPILMNAAAVGLLVIAGLALFFFFNRRERFITSARAGFISTEGALLQAVREDARAQISQKDQEITDIQKRLETLNQERDQLRLEGDVRLRQREEELLAAMDRTLEAEREKLKTQGLSAQDLESQMRRLQEQIDSRNQQDLEALRQQVESERDQREVALKALEEEYRQSLERLDGDKARLQEQLRQQERELSERFRRETAALESERTKTAESLSRLNEQRRQEQLAFDQILSFYEQLRGDLAKPDYDQALRTLSAFETALSQDPLASLSTIQRRRPVELFVIDSFRKLIDRQRASSLQTTGSLLAAAELLAAIQQEVSKADQAYQGGQIEAARNLYLSALSKIPELQHSYEVINRMDQQVWQAERQGLEARIETLKAGITPADQELAQREQQLRTDFAGLQAELVQKQREFAQKEQQMGAEITGLQEELVQKQREFTQKERQMGAEITGLQAEIAQKQKELVEKEGQMRAEITGLQQELERVRSDSQVNAAISAEKRRRLLDRLQSLQNRYDELASRSTGAAGAPEQELLSLLETKLLLKEVLVSEPVRARYPDLYDKTEKFLQVFGEVLQKEGQLATLRDLSAITESLSGDVTGGADDGMLGRYADGDFRELFHQLLDSLRLMVP